MTVPSRGTTKERNILAREPRAREYARLLAKHGDNAGRVAFWDALETVKRLELTVERDRAE